jgi:hypothetical protein
MYKEILTSNQVKLLDFISGFSRTFYLAGGTAVALYIGHRQSIDFDLFTGSDLQPKSIKNKLAGSNVQYKILHEAYDQLHILTEDVKITFFNYPFDIPHEVRFEKIIKMPELIDLAAMKAFALGGRAKWKDYVDLYFLLRDHFTIHEIGKRSYELYRDAFNLKLFRQQLAYFKDIDYSESVNFVSDRPEKEKILQFLIKAATEPFI